MIWDNLDEQDWKKAAPYVDTVLVAVCDIKPENKLDLSSQTSRTVYVASEIERQLKGRVMLMPPVSYLSNEPWFQSYVSSIRSRAEKGGFRHLFFVVEERVLETTPGVDWGTALTVSGDDNSDAQIRQLCEQIVRQWQEEV